VVESVYSAVRTGCLYKRFITVVESVYSVVRTDALYKGDYVSSFNGQIVKGEGRTADGR
jgi:hypothetical protein